MRRATQWKEPLPLRADKRSGGQEGGNMCVHGGEAAGHSAQGGWRAALAMQQGKGHAGQAAVPGVDARGPEGGRRAGAQGLAKATQGATNLGTMPHDKLRVDVGEVRQDDPHLLVAGVDVLHGEARGRAAMTSAHRRQREGARAAAAAALAGRRVLGLFVGNGFGSATRCSLARNPCACCGPGPPGVEPFPSGARLTLPYIICCART